MSTGLRKRNGMYAGIVLLGMVVALLSLILVHLVAPANAGPNGAPQVIPSLREWQSGTGQFAIIPSSHIVVNPLYNAQLKDTATVFQTDVAEVSRQTLPIIFSSSPATGDFFLTLGQSDAGLGDEGYLFTVGDLLTISANTSKGVFYGTRTALQILIQDPVRTHIERGVARDYPRYKERGFMLDAGRKFFSISFLEDYVKFMSWYKMNDFHIHLNDNAIGGGDSPDWMHAYAAFRLNSDRFKGLAAKDGSYTRQDIRALEEVARTHAVTITPEIDAPAHALALTQYRPDLASQKYSKEFLDLDNPATYTFMNSLWDEFLPWFDTSQVDIGTDEYAPTDADKYRQFINTYDTYLKQKGKSVRMWGSLSKMASTVKVNPDIVVDVWNARWANPVDMVNQGFHVINAIDKLLYIVPKAGYYQDYLNTKQLYEQWEPNIFDFSNPSLNLSANDPRLIGGMFAEWNDRLGSFVSNTDVHERVKPAMQTLGQKLWSGPNASLSYDQFQQLAEWIGDAPGTHLPQTPTLPITIQQQTSTHPVLWPSLFVSSDEALRNNLYGTIEEEQEKMFKLLSLN